MPKIGIGIGKFQSHVEFSRIAGRNEFDYRLLLFIRPEVSQNQCLALVKQRAGFHERAMRIYDEGTSRLREFRLIARLRLDDDRYLNKQALAAPFIGVNCFH